MRLSVIVAMAENRVIGRDNTLPWHLPNDLRHFRRVTMGHPIIMGRKSYESIGKPLPGRSNIIVTRQRDYQAPGCLITHSLADAVAAATNSEVFIIGGAELYAQALGQAQRLYLTLVHAAIDGDVLFPELDGKQWRELSRERREADGEHRYPYSFVTLERVA